MRCPHCLTDDERMLEQVNSYVIELPDGKKITGRRIFCNVCSKFFVIKEAG